MHGLQAETHALLELLGRVERESDELRGEVERLTYDLQAKEGQYKASLEQLLAAGQQQQVCYTVTSAVATHLCDISTTPRPFIISQSR